MALARWNGRITDAGGNAVTGAQVEVRLEVSGELVPLFADRAGTVPKGNPFLADSTGYAFFHAQGGAYRIRAFSQGFEQTWRFVGVGLGAETDFSIIQPAGRWDAGSTYDFGMLVFHEGFSFISLADENIGNEPDSAGEEDTEFWMFAGVPVGGEGPPGSPGSAAVTGSSTSTVNMSLGEKTLVVAEENRGWAAGARLRISRAAIPWDFMEGVITSYSGSTLMVDVDNFRGAGEHSAWKINLTGEPSDVTQELFDLRDQTEGYRDDAAVRASNALIYRNQAEDARDVAIENNSGPIGGEPWDSTKVYFQKRRCTHIGLSWFASTANINSEPSLDNPDWSLAGLPEERYMQALLTQTWPSGMTFLSRVGQVNSHATAGTGAVIGLTPTVTDGNQWASGTFFPRTTSRSWYWVEANINVFCATAGTFVAALFMNDVCIGVGRKTMTAGQFEFPWKVASQGLRQSPTSSPRALSLRVGNHTGGTGVFHRNGNAEGGLYSGLINTVLIVNELVIQP